ncbi:MAG: hypothetical protein ACD_78C00001G0001 [uncultured bacterium (gcode 4)]|uniref:Uncharacterized protein n=1 Tax=uncultured bacterium (gcode 4) TaxID=1234023 RepID=K1YEA4_9BACT|nr:MAG: hypothetical protein ACD_78C00001G0001 [uncultured bacterium (gcode 4)]
MEQIGQEDITEIQTRIHGSLLMDSKTKEYLRMVVQDPEIAKLVKEHLETYVPYEQTVLEEMNPKIQQFVSQWEKWIESIERLEEKEEVKFAIGALQYI